jgi:hypothetical protein
MYVSQVCYSAACAARVKKEKTGAARLPRRRIPPPAGLPSVPLRSVPQRHCEAQSLELSCITTLSSLHFLQHGRKQEAFQSHDLGGVAL